MKRINIRDVASHAGVSAATVSHVINHTKPVSDETRKKVESSIDALSYQSAPPALPDTKQRTHLIGLIVADIGNTYFVSYARALEAVLKPFRYRLLIANSDEDPVLEAGHITTFAQGIVDGMLISSTFNNYAKMRHLIPEEFPTVFFDRMVKGCPFDTIVINNYDALFRGIESLILQNHTKIGCFTCSLTHAAKEERMSAYKAAIEKYGLREYYAFHYTRQATDLYPGVKELLRQGCTAIVAFNANITAGIINSLFKMDKIVGKDIEVLAYQDSVENEIYSHLASVYIKQPIEELARLTAHQILDRIEHPELPVKQTVLQAYLNKRNDRFY